MKQKGFTLIELLVVISIIGTLSSTVLVSVKNVRMKARDARRIADLEQIQRALELYYADNNAYPEYTDGGLPGPNCNGAWAGFYEGGGYANCWADLETKLSPYLRLPKDPIYSFTPLPGIPGPDLVYWYQATPDGQRYRLLTRTEKPIGGVSYDDDDCYTGNSDYYCAGTPF